MSKARWSEALTALRQTNDPLTFEGIAIPYGQASINPVEEYGKPEAFAPGAFAGSVAHWMDREDGGRMPFRARHGAEDIGTVTALRDDPAGVAFTLVLDDSPEGNAYARKVRAGRNGVSAEFLPDEGRSARLKDGTVLHRQARLYAIAGSIVPAYEGARLSLRDMDPQEEPVPEIIEEAAETALVPEPAPEPVRAVAERATLAQSSTIRITRPELVYGRNSDHNFLRDDFRSKNGDTAAYDRIQKHQGFLAELSVQMERDAVGRMYDPSLHERASDVLSSEIPGAYPTDFVPSLLTPRILKGRPMGSFYNRVPISDARPRTFPKVTTSTSVAVQSAEGAALTGTDLATTAVTVTPLMYGAFTDVSRQAIDGADPSATAMIYQDLIEAYAQASETVIKTAVEAGSTASGVAITAATPYAGTLANVINYYAVRFKAATGAFIPSALYPVLLAQGDTTGRPFLPQLGQTNADGLVADGGVFANVLSAGTALSYASTANVCVFARPLDFVIFESSIATFSYDQVVGPQAVRIGLWAYLVVGTRLGSLKVTAA